MVTLGVRHLYVHAPFCVRRCVYCDFAVSVRREGDAGSWLAAVAAELELVRREGLFHEEGLLRTLYVGGGTPSLLGGEAMQGLAGVLGREALAAPELEWTAEANPESFTPELASAWRDAGVTRVSLGIQTFHEPALRWMGRLHGARGARDAVATARRAGFDNLSVDLIFGLPRHLGRDWRGDLEAVLSLEVEHVSLYGLSVEAGTPLGRAVAEGRERLPEEEGYAEEYMLAAEVLAAAGYEHYEVSNFARPGRASRHNRAYWTGVPYLGLGNGAHSFAPPVRYWNVRAWEAYEARVRRGIRPEEGRETLGPAQRRLERIWLGLRTADGLPLEELAPGQRRRADGWVDRGWATLEGARLRLTPRGWLLLDRLAVELDEVDDDAA